MEGNEQATVVCQVCGDRKELSEVLPGTLVRDSIVDTIRKERPD
jgi:hypothetical protein